MKSQIIITTLLVFGFLGVNAQTLLTCTGSQAGAKVSFVSKSGQDIKLKMDWDEGATLSAVNLVITNGTCSDCPRVGGIGRPHGTTQTWTIRQTDPSKKVSIAWANPKFCGGEKSVIPGTGSLSLDGSIFRIRAADNQKMCLDVTTTGIEKSGGKIHMHTCHDVSGNNHDETLGNQFFKFEKVGNDTYKILSTAKATGSKKYYLDATNEGDVSANGRTVYVWIANSYKNQEWKVTENSDGTYNIVTADPKGRNMVLNVSGASDGIENGSRVHLWEPHGRSNEKWILTPVK